MFGVGTLTSQGGLVLATGAVGEGTTVRFKLHPTVHHLPRQQSEKCEMGIPHAHQPSHWFWLKRAEGKRALRFVVSTHPSQASTWCG